METIKHKKDHFLPFCYLILGSVEVNRYNLKHADSLLTLSKNHAIKLKQPHFLKNIDIQKAKLLLAANKTTEGIALLNTVEDYFIKKNDYLQLNLIYKSLEKAYLKDRKFQKAHEVLTKLHKNIQNKEKNKKLKYKEGTKFYKEIQRQLSLQNQQRAKNKLFYIKIITSLLLFISVGLFLFFKYRKKQQKQNDVIITKNEELNSKINTLEDTQLINQQQLLFKNILVNEKQSFLKSLLEDLKDLSKESNAKNRLKILNLHKKIQTNIKSDSGEEFEYYFDKVHPNFYKSMTEKGFVLSKNEMRLAALIKLNFSTKEISDITKKSINTIYMAKSRLKTKLNLNKEDSLYNYIQHI